jgi:hypothetical protein
MRQRSGCDPSDGAQGKQQGRLETVAGPDGIHDIYGRRLDLDRARFLMPCLRPLNSTRHDDQTCTRLNQ